MTPAGNALWHRLCANRLSGLHFRRQQVIAGFIADFYCHSAALVIELDGGIHSETQDYDSGRDQAMINRGFQILRFTNQEIDQHMENVLSRILMACQLPIPPAPLP